MGGPAPVEHSVDSGGQSNDKAELIAARLRDDPFHQERMRRFHLAVDHLRKDGRRHDIDEIKDALGHFGYSA